MRRSLVVAFAIFMVFPMAVAAQASDIDDDDEILVRVNGSDRVEAEESIGLAVVVNGDLELAGEISGAAIVIQGDMSVLSGAVIDGDLVVIDGDVTMRDGSVVNGDLYLSNDAEWIVEDGAEFNGEVEQGSFSPNISDDIAWQITIAALASWFGITLIAIITAVIFSGIGGKQLWSSAANLSARPGATILAAIAFWLAVTILIVPAVLSVVGIPLLPLLAMIGLIVWSLGYIAFATRVGALMTSLSMSDTSVRHPYLPSIAGVVLLQLLLLIAVGTTLGAGLIAWFGDDQAGLGLLTAIPAIVLYTILVLAGFIGGGAIILRALNAWTARD